MIGVSFSNVSHHASKGYSVCPMTKRRASTVLNSLVWFSVLIPLLLCCGISGCRDGRESTREIRRQEQKKAKAKVEQDHIADAWGYFDQLAELNENAAAEQIVFHLNYWLEQSDSNVDWNAPTELIGLLSEQHRQLTSNLPDKRFLPSDLNHFRTCYLMQRVSKWATDGPRLDPITDNWVETQKGTMAPEDWRALDRAVRLFDWTVRNICLEELAVPRVPFSPKFCRQGLFTKVPDTDKRPLKHSGIAWVTVGNVHAFLFNSADKWISTHVSLLPSTVLFGAVVACASVSSSISLIPN